MLKFGDIHKQKTSHRKDVDQIMDIVASEFKILPDDVIKDKGESGDIAIYLTKKFTNIGNSN